MNAITRVPFDLSKEEDRIMLRGRWIRNIETKQERQVTSFDFIEPKEDLFFWRANGFLSAHLFKSFIFIDGADAGLSVGKEVGN